MIDAGFPIIEYRRGDKPREWGRGHGEAYRDAIQELFEIRLGLMQEKNAALDAEIIEELAGEQWAATERLDPHLADELLGICEGAGMTETQIVVVNNYTDFRDIQPVVGGKLQDEGCSAVFVDTGSGPIAGQTWDMHGSAKRYVCVLDIPVGDGDDRMIVFSLVGCIGMMGYTTWGTAVGVNNINTDGATPGVVWPALVRATLAQRSHDDMLQTLKTAEVTSGHNYLVASRNASGSRAEMWEIMPGLADCASEWSDTVPRIYHTNHCIGADAVSREQQAALNSSTHIRWELLEKKIDAVDSYDDVYALLNDHENYPQSICSNHQTSAQDPSVTCGGGVGDLATGKVTMWRGDELHDDNFVRHDFQL